MQIDGFDWDDGNWPKCGKHGVSKAEIEALFDGAALAIYPDHAHSQNEKRFLAIAPGSAGRHGIFVGFTMRQRDNLQLVRPLSARYMHAKEIRRYERDKP